MNGFFTLLVEAAKQTHHVSLHTRVSICQKPRTFLNKILMLVGLRDRKYESAHNCTSVLNLHLVMITHPHTHTRYIPLTNSQSSNPAQNPSVLGGHKCGLETCNLGSRSFSFMCFILYSSSNKQRLECFLK